MQISRLLGLLFFFLTFQLSAQQYSSSDKKAIKLFEEAVSAINMREIEAGLGAIDKAIDRDPEFVEAWLLKADLHIQAKQSDEAIAAMKQSIDVAPAYFPNKYYTLGKLYMGELEYSLASQQFERLLQFSSVPAHIKKDAEFQLESCAFAANAMANPVPFEPINLGPGVNTWMPEYYPTITVDGSQLLFTREVMEAPSQGRGQEDFYMSYWDGENWGQAEPLKHINTPGNEGAPAISPDGQNMVFTACDLYGSYGPERQGYGSCDLFFSYKIGSRWAKAKNMGSNINSAHWESQPSLSADGKTIYFIRGDRNPRERKSDIFMAELNDEGQWSKPIRLSQNINTPGNEESVLIHPDGKTLYFSSDGHPGMGGLDIFMSTRQGHNSWSKPINLGYPINTPADENSLLVSPMGKVAYFSSNRSGGEGSLDLYSFELPEHLRPNPVGYVKGLVFDASSKDPLYARFELIDLETEEVVITSFSNSTDGSFLVAVPFNRKYALNASKTGYLFYSDHFDLSEESGFQTGRPLEVPMQKIADGQVIVLNNVFFDTDKFNLKEESRAELNKLASFMEINPKISIEIGGHTDNQGNAVHNQKLSENRANSVRSFLVENGVNPERLTAKGYGQESPVADNETEEGRAKNRRTEIKVLGQ